MPVRPHVLRKHACSGGHGQQHGRQQAEEGDARDGRQRLAEGRAGKHEWEDEAAAEACACTWCKSAQSVTGTIFCHVSEWNHSATNSIAEAVSVHKVCAGFWGWTRCELMLATPHHCVDMRHEKSEQALCAYDVQIALAAYLAGYQSELRARLRRR